MSRRASFFNALYFASASIIVAGLSVSTLPAFADETGSPTAATTSGDSGASASSGGSGSSDASIGSNTQSGATAGDNSASAGTVTGAVGTTSQSNGDQSTTAGAATVAAAGVTEDNTKLTATAAADANAGATSTTADGTAGTGGNSAAFATATNGDAPTAYTSAGSDNYAYAVGGTDRVTAADAGPGSTVQTIDGKWRTVTVAYTADGQYSIAIASPWRATAFSSTYSGSGAITVDSIFAAAKTAAQAYASAGKTTATAWAKSNAWSASGNSWGVSSAASSSYARAHVQIQITQSSPNASQTSRPALDCYITLTDWNKWKKLSAAQRMQYVHCDCPMMSGVACKAAIGQVYGSNKIGLKATISKNTTATASTNGKPPKVIVSTQKNTKAGAATASSGAAEVANDVAPAKPHGFLWKLLSGNLSG